MPQTFGKRGIVREPVRSPVETVSPAAIDAETGPELMKLAKSVGLVCVVGAIWLLRLYLFTSYFSSGPSQIPGFIPQSENPTSAADGEARSADLVAKFPGDPRAHFYRAAKFLKEGDTVAAEQELRTALGLHEALTHLSPNVEPGIHLLLALAILRQGRRDDAKTEAQPACGIDIPEYQYALQRLRAAGICS